MQASWWPAVALAGAVTLLCGCFPAVTQKTAAETQCRMLAERNGAQLAEIENLKAHARNAEEQLARAEQELAIAREQAALERQRLTGYQRQADEMREELKDLAGHAAAAPTPATP
jgi:uncharacterized protein HemX